MRFLWIVVGAMLAAVAAEGVLRLLPVSMPLQRTSNVERWPLQNTEPHTPYSYSLGWSMRNAHRGVTNNYGHVAPFDFRAHSHPVVVVGDSFVEALMNDYGDTLQAALGRRIGAPQGVYGLGVSGLSASDYVAMARLARDEFEPRAAVVVVVDGDLSESLIARRGSHHLVEESGHLRLAYDPVRVDSLATRVRKAIGDVSLHRYFQVNLQFAPENLLTMRAHPDAVAHQAASPLDTARQRRVVDWFLDELARGFGIAPSCVALLLDSDRYAIYGPELATPRKDAPDARRYLIEEASRRGYRVRDLDPVFRERFARDHIRFDHYPIDRHWNGVGHRVAADEAYRLLFGEDTGGRSACAAPGGA